LRPVARMHILCALELRRGHDESATTMHHTFPNTPQCAGEESTVVVAEHRKSGLEAYAFHTNGAIGCIELLRDLPRKEDGENHHDETHLRRSYDTKSNMD